MVQSLEDYVHGLLNEEAGEIVQEIGKAMRFGMDTRSPMDGRYAGTTPRERLQNEVADMQAAIIFMKECGLLDMPKVVARTERKLALHRNPAFREMRFNPETSSTPDQEREG